MNISKKQNIGAYILACLIVLTQCSQVSRVGLPAELPEIGFITPLSQTYTAEQAEAIMLRD